MVEEEIARGEAVSLYPSQINAVNVYAKAKKYKFVSQAYQEIIDDFFTKDNKKTKKMVISYFIVPGIFCLLTTIVNISTDKVFNTLLQNGFFYNDLYLLSRTFMILSFGGIGVFIACIYLFYKKIREEQGKIYYGD